MGDTYGVTTSGFVVKPLDVCLSELQALAQGTFGKGIKLNASSKWGQFLGILSERESELWDALQDVHSSRDPDQAIGTDLEALCAITGIARWGATSSRASGVVLVGNAGTVIAAGKIASVLVTQSRFGLVADVTLVAVGAWAQATGYAAGVRRSAGGNVYEAIAAGLSSGAGAGPAGLGQDIVDGTVHWKWLGPGDSVGIGIFDARATGPTPAPTGQLATIETPVAGWTGIVNQSDAVLGRDVETDPALRLRREQTLAIAGSAVPDAIRAEVMRVSGVAACIVFFNDLDVVDADGMPPHSIEVMVSGGVDAEIAAAVWRSKAAGIQAIGGVSVVVVDKAGQNQTVKFSRPDEVPVYLAITLSKNADYPSFAPPNDGDSLVKAAVVAWGQKTLVGGVDLYPRATIPAIFTVAGVYDVPHVYAGLAPAPGVEAPVAITSRQVAVLDTARITIAYA